MISDRIRDIQAIDCGVLVYPTDASSLGGEKWRGETPIGGGGVKVIQ